MVVVGTSTGGEQRGQGKVKEKNEKKRFKRLPSARKSTRREVANDWWTLNRKFGRCEAGKFGTPPNAFFCLPTSFGLSRFINSPL